MSIHYKFRSTIDYKTLQLDGLSIRAEDLVREICNKEGIRLDMFNLLLQNAYTEKKYSDDEMVPRNSSIILQRVPRVEAAKVQKVQSGVNSGMITQDATASPSDFAAQMSSVDYEKMDENERLNHIKDVSTRAYDPSNFRKKTGGIMSGPPPPTYTCNRCYQPGHWYKNCPMQSTKRTTGIPSQELIETTPDDPAAMLHPSGKYVIHKMHYLARQAPTRKTEDGSGSPAYEKPPSSLICPLCNHLIKEAVITSCCGSSFCSECINQKLLESEVAECPSLDCDNKELNLEAIVRNKSLRDTVEQWLLKNGGHNVIETPTLVASSSSAAPQQEQIRIRIGLQPKQAAQMSPAAIVPTVVAAVPVPAVAAQQPEAILAPPGVAPAVAPVSQTINIPLDTSLPPPTLRPAITDSIGVPGLQMPTYSQMQPGIPGMMAQPMMGYAMTSQMPMYSHAGFQPSSSSSRPGIDWDAFLRNKDSRHDSRRDHHRDRERDRNREREREREREKEKERAKRRERERDARRHRKTSTSESDDSDDSEVDERRHKDSRKDGKRSGERSSRRSGQKSSRSKDMKVRSSRKSREDRDEKRTSSSRRKDEDEIEEDPKKKEKKEEDDEAAIDGALAEYEKMKVDNSCLDDDDDEDEDEKPGESSAQEETAQETDDNEEEKQEDLEEENLEEKIGASDVVSENNEVGHKVKPEVETETSEPEGKEETVEEKMEISSPKRAEETESQSSQVNSDSDSRSGLKDNDKEDSVEKDREERSSSKKKDKKHKKHKKNKKSKRKDDEDADGDEKKKHKKHKEKKSKKEKEEKEEEDEKEKERRKRKRERKEENEIEEDSDVPRHKVRRSEEKKRRSEEREERKKRNEEKKKDDKKEKERSRGSEEKKKHRDEDDEKRKKNDRKRRDESEEDRKRRKDEREDDERRKKREVEEEKKDTSRKPVSFMLTSAKKALSSKDKEVKKNDDEEKREKSSEKKDRLADRLTRRKSGDSESVVGSSGDEKKKSSKKSRSELGNEESAGMKLKNTKITFNL